MVARSGSAREINTLPTDRQTAHEKAERVARLVGRLVDAKLARRVVVVVLAIDSGAEVERVPVRVRRRAGAEKAAPVPIPRPVEEERTARRELLRNSVANRMGWQVRDAAVRLIHRFEREAHSGAVWFEFARAGVDPASPFEGAEGMQLTPDYFDQVAADVTGFSGSLQTFARLVECGLVRRPDAPDATPAGRRKAVAK